MHVFRIEGPIEEKEGIDHLPFGARTLGVVRDPGKELATGLKVGGPSKEVPVRGVHNAVLLRGVPELVLIGKAFSPEGSNRHGIHSSRKKRTRNIFVTALVE
jgi:hypothetical protein